jgi:uncharacterized protein (TIGR02246 family)
MQRIIAKGRGRRPYDGPMVDRDADRRAIRAIVAEHERGFNEKDPGRLAAGYRELSWAVDARGVEVEGRAAMLEAARAMPADQHARFAPGDVELLGDDAAIMHAYVSATTPAGEPLDVGHAMIKLYVFARGEDGWEVVARQDTLVR